MAEWQFIRPLWLLALLPLAIFLVCLWRRGQVESGWENLVDDALKPHVLEGVESTRRVMPFVLGSLLAMLTILVLAGPVWEQRPQPMLQAANAQVIALDVSRSMDTADRKPTRLTRAKHKVSDLLAQSAGMQTALA